METTVDEMKEGVLLASQELNHGGNCCLQGSEQS
jgi:hypothetical protein